MKINRNKLNKIEKFHRPKKSLFNKNPQLYDLGLNQSKLEDTLEVIQKIHNLEKVSTYFVTQIMGFSQFFYKKVLSGWLIFWYLQHN